MPQLPTPIKKASNYPSRVALLLTSPKGEISRSVYFTAGIVLFSIKYFIDGTLAYLVFNRRWSVLNYLVPGQAIDIFHLSLQDQRFFTALLLTSLPFIWAGVVLTVKRLRSALMPIWLVKFFFFPIVNCIFFALLCIYSHKEDETLLPSKETGDSLELSAQPKQRGVITSEGFEFGEALRAMLTSAVSGAALVGLGTLVFRTYGWGLFVGLPFIIGLGSVLMYGRNQPRSPKQCALVALGSVTILGIAIFLFAWEGLACLVMAAPIAYTLALMGAALGYHMQKSKMLRIENNLTMLALLTIFPLLMGAEYHANPLAPIEPVCSVLLIDAPPAMVWHNVIAFPNLPEPTENIFKLGIAYPIGAEIQGHGPGAIRRCQFSTGAFVEPIKVWDEPNLLKFDVLAQPPPMQEFSFRREINPAHLQGYLNVQGGQFKLSPITLADGRVVTRLEGTTWYRNQMWPNIYWRLWSNHIIHTIHIRVLQQIAILSKSSQ